MTFSPNTSTYHPMVANLNNDNNNKESELNKQLEEKDKEIENLRTQLVYENERNKSLQNQLDQDKTDF